MPALSLGVKGTLVARPTTKVKVVLATGIARQLLENASLRVSDNRVVKDATRLFNGFSANVRILG